MDNIYSCLAKCIMYRGAASTAQSLGARPQMIQCLMTLQRNESFHTAVPEELLVSH